MADVRFIRKNGKIIPIGAVAKGAARTAGRTAIKAAKGVALVGAASGIRKGIKQRKANEKQPIKVKAGFDALGLGLSVASGALGAATFSMGTKGFLAGAAAGHAIDVAGIAANVASVAGKGHAKERTKQGLRQEARNLIVGNAVYAAGILGVKRNREVLKLAASKILAFGRKALVGA